MLPWGEVFAGKSMGDFVCWGRAIFSVGRSFLAHSSLPNLCHHGRRNCNDYIDLHVLPLGTHRRSGSLEFIGGIERGFPRVKT